MANLPTVDNVPKPRRSGYDAVIDDLLVQLVRSPGRPMDVTTAPAQAQRIQTEQTAEDFLPEFGEVFSRNNFTGGSGLDFAYRADPGERDASRYWDSEGIDVRINRPGELAEISLHPDTEEVWEQTNGDMYMAVVTPTGDLFYGDSENVVRVSNPEATSPTQNVEDPHTGTFNIQGIAALGREVYVAVGTDGTAKRSVGGSWSDLGATATYGIWAAKGRIIGDDGAGAVVEIDQTTGAHTTLITMDPNDTVNDVIDAGPVILVASSSGTIYALVDNAGTLEIASQTRLTRNDVVLSMAHTAGVVLMGTFDNINLQGRIWSAGVGDANSGYTLTNAQLLRSLGNVDPSVAYASRDRLYVAVRRSSTESEVWRYIVATGGLVRDVVFTGMDSGAGTSQLVGLVEAGGVLWIGAPADGIWRVTPNSVITEGWIISPLADFFNPAEKTWISLRIEGLLNDGEIELYVTTNPQAILDDQHADWLPTGRITDQSQLGLETLLPEITGRYAAVQLRLLSGSLSPSVYSFALRSFSDSEDIILQLPVNVSDRIERPNRKPITVKNWGHRIFQALLGKDGNYVTATVYRPNLSVRGVIESVGTPVVAESERGSLTFFSNVAIRGKVVLEGTSQAAGGNLGVKLLGVHKLGT